MREEMIVLALVPRAVAADDDDRRLARRERCRLHRRHVDVERRKVFGDAAPTTDAESETGAPALDWGEDQPLSAEEKAQFVIRIPDAPALLRPLATVVPLQFLAYHIARLRGCDIDQPRNLAKTVTVE